ncbi:carbohydrate kinase family protein [Virgibacillus ihumii]|uniref:carbohydrate kinase family protein n=1 Tax=Virgibacillus ihumii TaxID=2686091 RepID=UPI00157BFC7F|nr:carbohydrate kinase [Virgibacillus ihumii]
MAVCCHLLFLKVKEERRLKSSTSVVCIGELLIDFFCTDIGVDLLDGINFEKQAGGAPANVCATVVRLGGDALFSGKVGNDPFGYFLKNTLEEWNIDTSMLVLDDQNPTTLAFVSLKENGERDFVFNRGADAYLTKDEIDKAQIEQAGVLHFGSATALLDGPFQSTYLELMETGRGKKKFVSFDPNYRKDLWKGNLEKFIKLTRLGIANADFVKVSNEELQIISETNNLDKGVDFFHQLGSRLVAVTLGEQGTFISNGKDQTIVPSIEVKAVDSTGAGDAFVGAMLFQLAEEHNPKELLADFEQVKRITILSNKVGAKVCTKVGAFSAIPEYGELF